MAENLVCFACDQPAIKQCRATGCTHPFCASHGDFICAACEDDPKTRKGSGNGGGGALGVILELLVVIIGAFFAGLAAFIRGIFGAA
jgi:hypothetical protein